LLVKGLKGKNGSVQQSTKASSAAEKRNGGEASSTGTKTPRRSTSRNGAAFG